MYRLILKKENTILADITDNNFFLLSNIDNVSRLIEFDNKLNQIWIAPEKDIYSLLVFDDLIIYNVGNKYIIARNIVNKKVKYTYSHLLHIFAEECDNKYYYCNTNQSGFMRFNYITGKIDKTFPKKQHKGLHIVLNKHILLYKENTLYMNRKSDFTLLWQKDLSKLCGYKNDETRIEEVFNDDTYLYVLVGLSVVKLEISTGNIIWHIPLGTSQSTGLLKDGFLYTTSNATLNKICIKTGKVIYAIFLIDFLLENNYNINGGMRELVWNDNYIWTIMHTYPETILKINPDNGNIEDILSLPELGVTSTALEIQFHKDKLYISDIDGNLHILEKESDDNI